MPLDQLDEITTALRDLFTDKVVSDHTFRDERSIVVKREALTDIATYCRDTLGFDYLVDASAVDNMGEDPRFEMVYELYSYSSGTHLRIKCQLPEDGAEIDSLAALWPTADWHEREAYDMMGIQFKGHPDLRRILMWEGYPYFPLRKEFPLGGKASEMPDVAFTGVAPLEGGPFVTSPTTGDAVAREPRSLDQDRG